jgi:magnesium-transporting ATPase (P-type)
MIYKWGYHFDEIREQVKPLNIAPFSSERKRMSVVYYLSDRKRYYIFSKGAPEILIQNCKYYMDKDGKNVPIDSNFNAEFNRIISEFSNQSLRTILLCYREVNQD